MVPIETITNGINSLIEDDSSTALVLNSVRQQAKSPNIKIQDSVQDPPTNEYYMMSEELSINKLNTEKQPQVMLPSPSQTSIVMLAQNKESFVSVETSPNETKNELDNCTRTPINPELSNSSSEQTIQLRGVVMRPNRQ